MSGVKWTWWRSSKGERFQHLRINLVPTKTPSERAAGPVNASPAPLQVFRHDPPFQIAIHAVVRFHHFVAGRTECPRGIMDSLSSVRLGNKAGDVAGHRVEFRGCRFG